MNSCCGPNSKLKGADLVLAGNPNVGKSVLINQLTGIGAIVSNYPGTTVEILEGKAKFEGKEFRVADLPGMYSLKGNSDDEEVAVRYLDSAKPKAIINVIDATKLERNIFLTLQLLGCKIPLVVALNFYEEAEEGGVNIDVTKLSTFLGVPVVPINALTGVGVDTLVKVSLSLESNKQNFDDIETEEQMHETAAKIAMNTIKITETRKPRFSTWLDKITTAPLSGSLILIAILTILFASLFTVGGNLSDILGNLFETYAAPLLTNLINMVPNTSAQEILKYMFIDGLNAGLQIAIPFIFVFYAIIAIMEDSGYIPRMAFLLDKVMHKFGLHGKAIIPMMLGFGCTVPAIISTRVLQTERERLLTTILILLIPCSARTAVILGAVGVFLGWQYALLIYSFILILMIAAGLTLGKALPGERLGLIMEIPQYRLPSIKNVLMKTWIRVSDFIFVAFPLIFIGSGILGGLKVFGLLTPILQPFDPIIGGWLMLPTVAGVTLLFGILRKELALELLIVLGGSANLLKFMTPIQVFTFVLVVSIYVPCIATIGMLKREFGWKKCLAISLSTIGLAVLIGGIAARLLPALGLLR